MSDETETIPQLGVVASDPVGKASSSNENKEQEEQPKLPPICKHWARSGSCLYHSKGRCKFRHPEECVPKVQPRERHRSKGGRLQTRNDCRVIRFRAFIASHFGPDNPLTAQRVLDVAGGKGELGFQMAQLCHVESVHVVDPRSLKLGHYQMRWRRGFYHTSAKVLYDEIVDPKPTEDTPPEEKDVGHLRCLFSSELWVTKQEGENGDGASKKSKRSTEEQFQQNCYRAQAWTWPPKGNDNEHCAEYSAPEEKDDEEDKDGSEKNFVLPTFDHASDIVRKATLIVGMHPDQAVDAIVDAALALNVSFFVVPCCTYSHEFPHRRTTEGKQVTKYDELLDYLQAKSPDIQRTVLPFEGKNICLYRVVVKDNQEEQEEHKD